MILREGYEIPFGYGFVCFRPDFVNGAEYQPIPWCWIKRAWYLSLRKTRIRQWEKDLMDKKMVFELEAKRKARVEVDEWKLKYHTLEELFLRCQTILGAGKEKDGKD